jgi:hypothetical protein
VIIITKIRFFPRVAANVRLHEWAKREVAARAYRHGECGKRSTLAEQSKRKIKKGAVAAELSERLDVGRPEMFGGLFVPNISGSMGSD